MSNFLEAAKEILKKKKQTLHYKEITLLAIENGLIETKGLTPEATMRTILTNDTRKKGMSSDFISVGKGMFSINDNKIDANFF